MPKRTQASQAPTNFTETQTQGGASSYLINRKREMFLPLNQRNSQSVNMKHIVEQNGSKLIPKNVLIMNPIHLRSVTWPEVFMPDEELYVTLKGSFYCIRDSRGKQKFINRHSMPNSQIVNFKADKEGDKLMISSVQKFLKQGNKSDQLWYHINVAILNVQTEEIERFSSVQKGFNQINPTKTSTNLSPSIIEAYNMEFKGIQFINNAKEAFVVFEPVGTQRSRYQVVLIDFMKTRKSESSDSLSFIQSSKKLQMNTQIVGRVTLQRKDGQTFLNLINSEYGDIVLFATSHEIYEIEIGGQLKHNEYALVLKPYSIGKFFAGNKNTQISNQAIKFMLQKKLFTQGEKIIHSQYLKGLKIIILTSHGRVFVVQSQKCIFSESLYQSLSVKEMIQNYNIEHFLFQKIHFLRGLLVVEVEAEKKEDCNLLRQVKHQESILEKMDEKKNMQEYASRGLIILKVQSYSLSLSKFIPLPFELKDYDYLKIHPFKETDELLIQAINNKTLQTLKLYRCQLISNKNSFIPFSSENILKEINITLSYENGNPNVYREIDARGPSKVTFAKSHKVFYVFKGNQVTGYRIHSSQFISGFQKGTKKIVSMSFFQKPQKVITNPLTGQVIILFREFIKFFKSTYNELRLVYQMNIPLVKDISFSRYGENILLTMNDNSIHLIDSYQFTQRKIMDFYGDAKEVQYPNEYFLCVKTTKNVLNIFKKKPKPVVTLNQKASEQIVELYDKLYEVKIENDDLYNVDDCLTVIIKRTGQVQFYSHVPETRSSGNTSQDNEKLRLQILQKESPHLMNRKKLGLDKNEHATYFFFSSQFSTLFVGTSFGNIRQYLYPFLSIEDPSLPQFYHCPVSNNAIIHIEINADFSALYVVSQKGQILQLGFDQFLNGLRKNGIYVISKTQNSQTSLKYEFSNRNYLINEYTPNNDDAKKALEEKYEEISFVDDKIKNDIEDITTKIRTQSTKEIQLLSSQKKRVEGTQKREFEQFCVKMTNEEKIVAKKLVEMRQVKEGEKQGLIEKYERELLQIYRQNDRLKGIMMGMMKEFESQKSHLKQELQGVEEEQRQLMEAETARLESSYQKVKNKYSDYSRAASSQIDQHTNELQSVKQSEVAKYQTKLKEEQLRKESKLSTMGKIQKEIERYKKRSLYFQNLIVQTRNQIEELSSDVDTYEEKKNTLINELQDKEFMIEDKQTLIVKYLKKNNEMEKIKNVHQFELEQFESEIDPIHSKIAQLETQVQKMNNQVMQQFNSKIQQNSQIENTHTKIQKLKEESHNLIHHLLISKTKLKRFTEDLSSVLANDPFASNLKLKISHVIDKFSKENETFQPNQDLQKAKKLGQKLMRKKTMLLKSIDREEKLQEGLIKNKNQFFRFYSDNTNLVKEYNELFKDHNILLHEKTILQQKINSLKSDVFKTPRKRTSSLNIRKVSDKRLTPFQRYEQQQVQLSTLKLKQKDTTETRLSRGESSAFLKSLIKDVSIAENNFQKSNLIRDRIRTFVNPQLQRQKEIQKQLFQRDRQRGKSNFVATLKL